MLYDIVSLFLTPVFDLVTPEFRQSTEGVTGLRQGAGWFLQCCPPCCTPGMPKVWVPSSMFYALSLSLLSSIQASLFSSLDSHGSLTFILGSDFDPALPSPGYLLWFLH